jgi:hypothetical protein
MNKLSSVALVVALAACRHKEPASPSMTAAGPRPCAQMADHLVELMSPDGAAEDTIDAIRKTLRERCSNDRWTIDAQQCYLEAKAYDATVGCDQLLTIDQREAFGTAMGEVLGPRPTR